MADAPTRLPTPSLASVLPVLAFSMFGPSMVAAALQTDRALPTWSRWALGGAGLLATGVGLKLMLETPSAQESLTQNFAKGMLVELRTVADPKAAAATVAERMRVDPAYYTKLVG